MNLTLLTKVGRRSIRYHIRRPSSWKWLWAMILEDTMDDWIESCSTPNKEAQ